MSITAQFSFGPTGNARRREPGDRPCFLIMGDWLGDTPPDPLGGRKPPRIDIDNFETVMERLSPGLDLPDHGALRFASLEDFHPDALCRRSTVLLNLLNLYRNLGDPAQARSLIEHIERTEPAGSPESSPPASDSASPFEQLLGGKVQAARTEPVAGGLQRLLNDLVAPHVVDTRAVEPYRQATALALGEHLRNLLQQPRLRALEANWRGLWWLLTQIDNEAIELRLLQLSRAELQADLQTAGTDLANSRLCRQLFEADNDTPWSLLTGLYTFSATDDDIRTLAALGALANAAGAPFLAGADPSLVGCRAIEDLGNPSRWQPLDAALAERWQALRQSTVARWLNLALPRLLLRQPYGSHTDPLDGFEFEERSSGTEPLLWGSAALGTTLGLGLGFQEHGWELDPAQAVELEDLPSFSYSVDDETRLQSATETVLTERAVHDLAGRGLTPLIGYRNRTGVRLPGCVALSGTIPAGPWS